MSKVRKGSIAVDLVVDFFEVQTYLLTPIITGYPSIQNRIRTGLDRLKRNLNDENLPEDLRKELEKQIEEYEDFYYNYYLSIENDENKRRIFSWLYRGIVEKVFAGKADIRELICALVS